MLSFFNPDKQTSFRKMLWFVGGLRAQRAAGASQAACNLMCYHWDGIQKTQQHDRPQEQPQEQQEQPGSFSTTPATSDYRSKLKEFAASGGKGDLVSLLSSIAAQLEITQGRADFVFASALTVTTAEALKFLLTGKERKHIPSRYFANVLVKRKLVLVLQLMPVPVPVNDDELAEILNQLIDERNIASHGSLVVLEAKIRKAHSLFDDALKAEMPWQYWVLSNYTRLRSIFQPEVEDAAGPEEP